MLGVCDPRKLFISLDVLDREMWCENVWRHQIWELVGGAKGRKGGEEDAGFCIAAFTDQKYQINGEQSPEDAKQVL